VIIKLKVAIGKYVKINKQGHPLQMTWMEHGCDSAFAPAGAIGVREEIASLALGPPAENIYRNGRGKRPRVRSGCPSDGIATRSDVRKSFESPQS
jgi:hypothetical protein